MSLREDVAACRAPVAVWGCGPIGLSTALALADAGFSCTGVDPNDELVACLERAAVPFAGFEDWMKIPLAPLLAQGRLRFSTDPDAARDAAVHVVAVNTDAGEDIDRRALMEVAACLGATGGGRARLVSIESTVAPGWLEDFAAAARGSAAPPTHLGVAPRRDWFLDDCRDLRTLPRVVGGEDTDAAALLEVLYGHVCDEVVPATDWVHASLVKSVENAMRFLDIVLVNQLSSAFPGIDVAGVLRLAATKWNVPSYHPSVGIGGYCVPLGPRYLLEALEAGGGAAVPVLAGAIDWNRTHPQRVAARIMAGAHPPRRVLLLGLSYAPDVKISRLSPASALARALVAAGADVGVHDPYFDGAEIRTETGCPPAGYPDDLAGADLVVVVAAHAQYADLARRLAAMEEPPAVLDNLGALRAGFAGSGLDYREMGGMGALEFGDRGARAPR